MNINEILTISPTLIYPTGQKHRTVEKGLSSVNINNYFISQQDAEDELLEETPETPKDWSKITTSIFDLLPKKI